MAFFQGTTFLLTSFPLSSRRLGGSVITQASSDPLKVAPNELGFLLTAAKVHGQGLAVNVLAPVKYELAYSYHQTLSGQSDADIQAIGLQAAGRNVAGSLLSSLEDSVLRKWIISALSRSVASHIFVFNTARWGIKEGPVADSEDLLDDDEPTTVKRNSTDSMSMNIPAPMKTDEEFMSHTRAQR
ncbi:3-hydroxy-3-methylglutaryl-coenzyme A reductase [Colletotrichum orchidophilum]|uniref:3-hydroxy-3-methylglutaryl-coenzyme A reductase n=1 Tax=Colletotrichum orchidophilum TaxID=1209926 RepID=A0A1G4BD30_9PEZI|nr:3-hydroxy-3-methylglutaryl-coenzyme A reductase [Colletotrichum orchidophilum]OHE99303.1 3-hydroxy-3-methylglutaryl-coenzyme A reductase [Colletotrichum orchidophilum]